MIALDTSVLIESLGAGGSLTDQLRAEFGSGHRIVLPTLVLYEWLRGPRRPEEIALQEALLPADEALSFGTREAAIAARLYNEVPRARGREVDLAIAACAMSWNARLWTLNRRDFNDVPGLRLR